MTARPVTPAAEAKQMRDALTVLRDAAGPLWQQPDVLGAAVVMWDLTHHLANDDTHRAYVVEGVCRFCPDSEGTTS